MKTLPQPVWLRSPVGASMHQKSTDSFLLSCSTIHTDSRNFMVDAGLLWYYWFPLARYMA